MVRRGEYLERAVVVPGGDVPIEGLYHHQKRRPGLLIAQPHPERGGSMEGPIVAELAWAVTRAGHPTLRFNYRGVGASGGTFDPSSVVETAALASLHLQACCDPDTPNVPLAAAGVGFGATVVAELCTSGRVPLTHLFLVSPEGLPEAVADFRGELVVIVGQKDGSDRDRLQALTASAPDGRLVVIPSADRAFLRGLVQLGRAIAQTLRPPGEIDLDHGDDDNPLF